MSRQAADLEKELRDLLVETNDQRRRVGQALYHFYRTLAFWSQRGKGFHETTCLWAGAGASILDALAGSVRDAADGAGGAARDGPLRTFLAAVWRQLADDLQRGEHMRVSFLRWLERQFPALTQLMREADAATRILDPDLLDELVGGLTLLAGSTAKDAPALLRRLAIALERQGP